MAVAKRGFGQMAIANCVGSKIVNVGVGLGLTWIMSILTTGKSIKVCDQVAIYHMALFHTAAIILFALLTVVASYIEGVVSNGLLLPEPQPFSVLLPLPMPLLLLLPQRCRNFARPLRCPLADDGR